MDEANQSYHLQLSEQSRTQIVRTIIAMAMFEARKEIKRKIQSEGRVKLCKVPHREIESVKRLPNLTPDRRPILTPSGDVLWR